MVKIGHQENEPNTLNHDFISMTTKGLFITLFFRSYQGNIFSKFKFRYILNGIRCIVYFSFLLKGDLIPEYVSFMVSKLSSSNY